MKKLLILLVAMTFAACPSKVEEKPSADEPAKTQDETTPSAVKQERKMEKPTHGKSDVHGKPFKGPSYEITYPSSWESKPEFMKTDTMALSKPEGPKDMFQENVNVALENLPAPMSAKQYVDANIKGMKGMLGGFKVVEQKEMKVDGQDGYQVIYRHSQAGMEFKVNAVFVTKGGGGFVITSTALVDSYDKWEGEFNDIIKTFKFK